MSHNSTAVACFPDHPSMPRGSRTLLIATRRFVWITSTSFTAPNQLNADAWASLNLSPARLAELLGLVDRFVLFLTADGLTVEQLAKLTPSEREVFYGSATYQGTGVGAALGLDEDRLQPLTRLAWDSIGVFADALKATNGTTVLSCLCSPSRIRRTKLPRCLTSLSSSFSRSALHSLSPRLDE